MSAAGRVATGGIGARAVPAYWVVYGPQGCGKTRNAERIRKALGLRHIVDDWQPGDPTPADTLLLTFVDDDSLPPRRSMSFAGAMNIVRDKGL